MLSIILPYCVAHERVCVCASLEFYVLTEGAKDGGWFLNFKIPFQRSVLVTAQHETGNFNFYIIVRGGTNIPLNLGNAVIPSSAQLMQYRISGTFQPLEWSVT